MVSVLLSRAIILTCGTLYPAYRSYKAIRTKNVKEYVKWMMYWVVFAMFLFAEAISDVFVSFWCPFYYELKILFVVWLLSPYTKGASFLYRRLIHPTLSNHELEIDQYLDKAKNESISYARKVSQQGLLYAKDVVAQVAIRSQTHLVNQLVKKSLSMDDLSVRLDDNMTPSTGNPRKSKRVKKRQPELPLVGEVSADEIEEEEEEEVLDEDEVDADVVDEEFKFLSEETIAARSSSMPRSKTKVTTVHYEASTLPRAASGARTRRALR